MTRLELRQVVERYIAGERPAAIATALGLDVDEVTRACTAPTSVGALAKAVTPPAKRGKRRKADTSADVSKPARPEDYTDPHNMSARRDGPASHRNHGYGYASIRAGGRRWL